MNTGVTLWINSLKKVRLGLFDLNDPQAESYILYLDEVIEFLEDYYNREKVYEGESDTEEENILQWIDEDERL
ncbi:hypothetical protein H6F98_03515 [Microcoleus sp. FACHB-SPT15]|uniref:hypothetical protein n=1 Tax=Microcoleus sp. FACHB-SPT15 TaxID=2692830 RepID=UPI00177D6582|nr:hypothetical protein [Microcoleus sp. FACHB-SPT15]MBD1804542.1 hypothetical protein [Microcoleus sp. FACHB-SPT15]